jgi:hypothetical protein
MNDVQNNVAVQEKIGNRKEETFKRTKNNFARKK